MGSISDARTTGTDLVAKQAKGWKVLSHVAREMFLVPCHAKMRPSKNDFVPFNPCGLCRIIPPELRLSGWVPAPGDSAGDDTRLLHKPNLEREKEEACPVARVYLSTCRSDHVPLCYSS